MISQRNTTDCGVCAFAMLSGQSYEDTLEQLGATYSTEKGTLSLQPALTALGYGPANGKLWLYFKEDHPADFPLDLTGLQAILSVQSLNAEAGWHIVYWDGEALHDPSVLKRYDELEQLRTKWRAIVVLPRP